MFHGELVKRFVRNPSAATTPPVPAHARHRRLCLGAMLGAALAVAGCNPDTPHFSSIDVTGADFGKELSLLDVDGRPRTLADYRGSIVLLFFGFTQCPDVCPTTLSRAQQVKKLLGSDASRLQVIFVTVDPERDTPEVLREYMNAFDPTFVGLHGDEAATKQAAEAFKVFYRKVPTGGSYTMDHTAISYVLDTQGRLRLAVQHTAKAEDIARDIQTLLRGA